MLPRTASGAAASAADVGGAAAAVARPAMETASPATAMPLETACV